MRARDDSPVDVDRIAGVGHEHRVALIQRGQHQMREAFLGTDGDNGFVFRVDVDVVAIGIPAGNSPAQAWDAARSGVAMGVFALCDRAEFFNDVRRCRAVRVAHAEVDNVFATAPRSHFQLGGDVEHIRGESIDARKAARRTLVCHVGL